MLVEWRAGVFHSMDQNPRLDRKRRLNQANAGHCVAAGLITDYLPICRDDVKRAVLEFNKAGMWVAKIPDEAAL